MARPKLSAFDRDVQHRNKRRAVLHAAGQAFRRYGFHNASMTEIAQSLGLSKAALYYYVKSKEEVLYACHIMVYDAMDEILKPYRTPQDSGLDDLAAIYAAFVRLLTKDGLALLADVNSLSGDFQTEVLTRRATIEAAVLRVVRRGMKDGSIRKADPQLTVYFFMGALNWLNVWYTEEGRLSGQDIAAHFTAQLKDGIAANEREIV